MTGDIANIAGYARRMRERRSRGGALPRHLAALEAGAIYILREVVACFARPAMLYSVGKDSSVMLHLALKAFWPASPPLRFMHIASGWDFRALVAHRDALVAALQLPLVVESNEAARARGVDPFNTDSREYARLMLTEALKAGIERHGFDALVGGGRRDEERSRAKERVFSIRTASHGWEPRAQRPELWQLYNTRLAPGETMRVFPLSDWTERDVWEYIDAEAIPVVPLYFARPRPVVERRGMLVLVDDERLPLAPGETPREELVRFRTLGCYPLSGAMPSTAHDVAAVLAEIAALRESERTGRAVDTDQDASMERKKREGYF
jgi:sulfate adenylyltransferase subunit 2